MSRTRIFYDHVTGARVEVRDDNYVPKARRAYNILPDLDSAYGGGFQSPINGEFITSRSQLRAHEQRFGVRQAGDFRKGEIAGGEQRRVERIREKGRGASFKWT